MDTSTSSAFLFSSVPGTGGHTKSNDTNNSSRLPPTATFIDKESDNDDVLKEKISDEIKSKVIEKAQRILSKYKTNTNCKTNPNIKISWLMHTIGQIIKTTDKVIQPHKYRFDNIREAAK